MEPVPGNNSTGSAPTGVNDRIRFSFSLNQAGNYAVYARFRSNGGSNDSFWVRSNNGTWVKFNSLNSGGGFSWIQVYDSDNGQQPVTFNMNAGVNTLDLAYREDGTHLDKIYITATGSLPSGLGQSASNCVPPAYLTANPSSLSYTDAGGSQNVSLAANVSWTATANEGWLSVLPASGSSDGTITITTAANNSINGRTGSVTASGGGLSAIIAVSQAGVPCTLSATATATAVSCAGGADGTAAANISGGTSPYSYAWSNGATGATASGLSAGAYTVTATDANGCTAMASSSVSAPTALSVSTSSTDATTGGGADGTATASTSGGASPYSYAWSNGATGATAISLTAGTYTVTVTDTNGCTASANVIVGLDCSSFSASASATVVSCAGGADGTAAANISGGTSPYGYAWSNGATGATASGLSAGAYTVAATDANGCTATASSSVSTPTALSVNASSTDETAPGENDGTATATVSGGTPSYSYGWSNGATTAGVSSLVPGIYSITVTDANGCEATAPATVNAGASGSTDVWLEAECATVGSQWQTLSDANASNGEYIRVPDNGIRLSSGPTDAAYIVSFQAALSQSGSYRIFNRTHSPNGSGDSYWVRANDGPWIKFNSLPKTGQFEWSQVWDSDNGLQPVLFNLIAGSNTIDFGMREDGTQLDKIYVTLTGNAPVSFGLPASNCGLVPLSVSVSTADESMPGANDGSAIATAAGGVPPYTYAWSNGATPGLAPGTYTVTVTDGNNDAAVGSGVLAPGSTGPCAFQESGGQVVMEAENYAEIQDQGDVTSWQPANSLSEAIGGSYVTTPDNGVSNATFTNGTKLVYNLQVNTAGTYTIYVRRYAPNGAGNSAHGGFDGQATGGVDNTGGTNQWRWVAWVAPV